MMEKLFYKKYHMIWLLKKKIKHSKLGEYIQEMWISKGTVLIFMILEILKLMMDSCYWLKIIQIWAHQIKVYLSEKYYIIIMLIRDSYRVIISIKTSLSIHHWSRMGNQLLKFKIICQLLMVKDSISNH